MKFVLFCVVAVGFWLGRGLCTAPPVVEGKSNEVNSTTQTTPTSTTKILEDVATTTASTVSSGELGIWVKTMSNSNPNLYFQSNRHG
jgi:hypothetical protein